MTIFGLCPNALTPWTSREFTQSLKQQVLNTASIVASSLMLFKFPVLLFELSVLRSILGQQTSHHNFSEQYSIPVTAESDILVRIISTKENVEWR